MIYEGIMITQGEDGGAHITPLGFEREREAVTVRPFVPSQTLDNLRRHPFAVMNFTDDVRVTAGCLTGRRGWPVMRAAAVPGWRLATALGTLELAVESCRDDATRPAFGCRVVSSSRGMSYGGFNRAQAAVLEAAILVSRLDFIDCGKLEHELAYLNIAVQKTAGPREQTAWHWLLDAVAAHPRHRFNVESLRCH